MSDTAEGAAPEHISHSSEVSEYVKTLALVFNQSAVYGPDHSVTKKTITQCHTILTTILEGRDSLNFAVGEGELLVDGAPLPHPPPSMKTVVDQLVRLGVASFSLANGIPEEEFAGLVELLHSKPEEMLEAGGFSQVVATLGMEHIRAKKVIIQQITEDDVVVSKSKLKKELDSQGAEAVLAVLTGDGTGDGSGEGGSADALHAAACNSSRLATMIMGIVGLGEDDTDDEAAEEGAELPAGVTASDVDDTTVLAKAHEIAESVERLYKNVAKGPHAKTQKGKKELIKALDGLRDELVSDLQSEYGEGHTEAESVIKNCIEMLKEDLRIDAMASEYAKKRSAIEKSEKRLLKYIESRGEDMSDEELREKLEESGLPPEGWGELLGKSQIGFAGEESDDVAEKDLKTDRSDTAVAAQALTKSLSQLEGLVTTKPDGQAEAPGGAQMSESQVELGTTITQIAEQVVQLAKKTETHIDKLVDKVKNAPTEKGKKTLSKRMIIEFLAEIVQELRQPLSVINSAVGAVGGGLMGEVSDAQKEMLNLAGDSAERMDHLTDKLLEISGLPTELTPDAIILDDVYDGDAPQATGNET